MSVATFCSDVCTKTRTCDNAIDSQTCANECSNANQVVVTKLRADVVDAVAHCYEDADCKSVLSGSELGACEAQAGAAIAPSSAASGFCADWSGTANACSATLDMAKCLDTVKVFADATLADAHACLAKSCSDVVTCIEASLGSSSSGGSGTCAHQSCGGTSGPDGGTWTCTCS